MANFVPLVLCGVVLAANDRGVDFSARTHRVQRTQNLPRVKKRYCSYSVFFPTLASMCMKIDDSRNYICACRRRGASSTHCPSFSARTPDQRCRIAPARLIAGLNYPLIGPNMQCIDISHELFEDSSGRGRKGLESTFSQIKIHQNAAGES